MKKSTNQKGKKKSPKVQSGQVSGETKLKPQKSSMAAGKKKSGQKGYPSPFSGTLLEEDVRAQIAQRAHELYEHRGRVPGYDFEDWLKAEQEILGDQMSRN